MSNIHADSLLDFRVFIVKSAHQNVIYRYESKFVRVGVEGKIIMQERNRMWELEQCIWHEEHNVRN